MKVTITVATAIALGMFSADAHAQVCAPPATGRSVSVTGASTIRIRPDRVSFSVGVQTDAPSVADAFKANSAKVEAVVAALKAKGVRPEELQTSNFEITSRDDEGRPSQGFRVANLVIVTRRDPESVGELLQAAVGAGANQAGGLRFFVAEPAKVRDRGLELAFKDAQAKARTLAGLSGRALGDVVCISDTAFPANGLRNEVVTVFAESPAVEVGVEEIDFSLFVVFELK